MALKPFRPAKKLWLLEQLDGLASALKQIHYLSDPPNPYVSNLRQQNLQPPSPAVSGMQKAGWHHDIKLANILYFRDTDPPRGTLRISDWGSGKVHTFRSGSVNTRSPNGTLSYEPPEVLEIGATSRPYDVWSLGCVFLELLVWVAWGCDGVQEFSTRRFGKRDPRSGVADDAFFQRSETGNSCILRESVHKHLKDLNEKFSTREQKPFQEILQSVVVPMLEIRSRERILARDVSDIVHNIFRNTQVEIDSTGTDHGLEPRGSTPHLPRLSYEPQGHRASDTIILQSPATSNAGYNVGFLTRSPSEMSSTSPRSYRSFHGRNNSNTSELTPTMASRSRNNSNASSTVSARNRGGSADPLNPDAHGSKDNER